MSYNGFIEKFHDKYFIVEELGFDVCVKGDAIHTNLRIYPDNSSAMDCVEVYYAPLERNLNAKTIANLRVFLNH